MRTIDGISYRALNALPWHFASLDHCGRFGVGLIGEVLGVLEPEQIP